MSMRVAALQFTAGPLWESHRDRVVAMVREAAIYGARLVATPENTGGMPASRERLRDEAPCEQDHPALADLAALARELGIWLLCGSLTVRATADDALPVNRSLLISPGGDVVARYDKIHLFDVDLPGGETHRESATIRPGTAAVLARLDDGVCAGLSICYDLRFAGLYRALARAGAHVLLVPSAFTVPTGRAHWEVLLRARAIETGSYVVAPAQCGLHEGGRQTYGHSLIIDPWGQIVAQGTAAPGIIYATLDPARVCEVRATLPALYHDRPFSGPTADN